MPAPKYLPCGETMNCYLSNAVRRRGSLAFTARYHRPEIA